MHVCCTKILTFSILFFQMLIMNDARDYHALLLANRSNEPVTLYNYPNWDIVCCVSKISKIIEPAKNYLHREVIRYL